MSVARMSGRLAVAVIAGMMYQLDDITANGKWKKANATCHATRLT